MKKIKLGSRSGEEIFSVIDRYNFDILSKHRWCRSFFGYAVRKDPNGPGIIWMHRIIMGAKHNQFVDHINGDKLDNRRCNLRFVNKPQNAWNSKIPSTNKSGHKNIYFNKRAHKWELNFVTNRKKIYGGLFSEMSDAILARNKYLSEQRGNFSRI